MFELHVADMSCGHCASAVSKAVKASDPDAKLSFNMAERIVHVTTSVSLAELEEALADAGYPVSR